MQANNPNAPKSVRWKRMASRRKALKTDSLPNMIPHQLFYPVIIATWIGAFLLMSPLLSAWDQQHDTFVGSLLILLGLVILCLVGSALLFVPIAIFDLCFPSSTRLTLAETYAKALVTMLKFVRGIVFWMEYR